MINYNEILEQLDKIYNTFSRGLIKTTAGIYKKHILNRISGQNKISNKEKHSDIVYDDNIFTRAAINFIDKHSDFYTNKRQKNDKIEQSFVKVTQAINQAKQDSIYGTLSTFNSLFNNNKLTLLSYPLSGCAADYVNALSCGITQYIDIYSNISGIYVSDIYNSGDSPLNYETHKTLNVIEGNKYIIYVNTPGHPVALQTVSEIYEISKLFTSGLTINGGGPALTNGNFEWDIPNNNNMPKTVYYVCTDHISEGGTINILKPLKVRAMPIRPEQTVTEDSVQIPLKYGGLSRIDALSNRATTCWDLDNFKYTAYDFWGKSGLNVTFPFYDTTGPYNTYFTWLTEPSNPSSLFPSFEYKNVDTCYLSNQNNQAYTVKIGQYEDPVLSEYNSPGDMDPFIRSTKWPARQVNLSINPYFSGRLSEHGTTGTIGILDNYNSIVCSTTGTSFRNISLVDIRANCYGVSPSASTLEGPTPLGQTLLTYSRCSYVLEIVDENNNPVDLPSSTMAQNIVSGTGYYAVTYLSLLVQNRQWHKDAGHAFINITAGNFGSGVEILDINEIGNQDPDYGPIPWLMGYGGATNMGDRTYRVGSVRGQYIAPYTSQGCIVQFAPNEIVDLDINGLSVGMYVRGPFVPIGTKITAIYAAAGNCPAYVVISNNIDDNYELGFNNVYYNYEFYNLGTINSINIEFPLRSNKGKLFEYALTNGLNVVTPIFWSFAFLQYWNDVTYPGGFYGVIYERNRYTSFAPSQFFSQDGFAYSDWEFNYQPSTVDPTCRDFSADPCYSGDILDYSGVPYLYYGRPQPDQGYGGALSAALDYGSADAYGDEDRLPNGYIDPSVEIFKNHRADARPSTLWAGNANVGFYHPDAIGNSSDNPFYVYTPHGFAHFLITLKSRLSAVQPLEWITEDECGDMTINHTKTVTTDINVILNNLHINIVSGIAGDYPESTNYARINNTVKFTGILYPPTGDTVINLATTVYPVGDNNFNDDVQPCFTDYVKYTSTTERRSTTNPRGHALGPYCYELPEKISFCSGGLSVGDEYYNLKITSLEELYDKKESCCPHYYCGCAGLTQEFGAFSRLGLCDAVGSSGGILTHLTEDSSYYNEMTRLGLTAVADFDPVLTVNNAALTLPSGEASGLCSCLASWVGAATWQIVRSYPCCDQPSNVKCPAIITSSLTGGCDEYDSNYVTIEQAFNDDGTLAFGSNPYTFYGEVFFENDDSMIESDIYWTATLGWYPTYASGTRPSGFFTDPNCIIDDIPSWSITDSGIITCSTASSASFGLYMSGEYMSLSMTLVGDCTGCFVLNEPLCGLGGSIVYS